MNPGTQPVWARSGQPGGVNVKPVALLNSLQEMQRVEVMRSTSRAAKDNKAKRLRVLADYQKKKRNGRESGEEVLFCACAACEVQVQYASARTLSRHRRDGGCHAHPWHVSHKAGIIRPQVRTIHPKTALSSLMA